MFIELVDSLRCVRPHELTWLVASATRMDARDIVVGELGCHVCGAEYPIVDGIADFTLGQEPQSSPSTDADATDADATKAESPALLGEEMAMRAAALLDLAEPGGFVALTGAWGGCAPRLAELAPRVHLLLLDPPVGTESGDGISLARVHDDIPIRPAMCRGVALDAAHATPRIVTAAVDALRPRGRLVAPASLATPAGITELARDERHWVGEKEAPAPIVRIRRK